MRFALAGLVLLAGAGCSDENGRPLPNFERMMDQHAYRTWEANPLFADGRSMRAPPRGTVPRDARLGDLPLTTGLSNGVPVAVVPIPLTRERLLQGRTDFETYCAACHGIAGDGDSRVAAKMELRRPPSLVSEPARSFAPGRVYHVIDQGYGLMRPYTEDLPTPERRWGVVAYVRALAIHHETSFDDLPSDLRAKANEALR